MRRAISVLFVLILALVGAWFSRRPTELKDERTGAARPAGPAQPLAVSSPESETGHRAIEGTSLTAVKRFAFSGRVLDPGQTPVANSIVGISTAQCEPWGAKTGPDGRFRIEGLPRGMKWSLVVLATGFCRFETRLDFDDSSDVVDFGDIVLSVSRDIPVRVVDEVGIPVEGVTVRFDDDGDRPCALTDAAGVALVPWSRPFAWAEVTMFPQGTRRFFSPDRQEVGTSTEGLTFVLREAGVARGVVIDGDGTPLSDIGLDTYEGEQCVAQVDTSSDGSFEALVPLQGTASIAVSRYFQPLHIPVEGHLLGVKAGDTGLKLVARKIPDDRMVRIRLEDPSGHPLPGRTLEVRDVRSTKIHWPLDGTVNRSVTTDTGGTACLDALLAVPLRVRANPDRENPEEVLWLPAIVEGFIPNGQEVVVRHRLGVWIEVEVVDPDGLPEVGRRVVRTVDQAQGTGETTDESGKCRLLVDPDATTPQFILVWSWQRFSPRKDWKTVQLDDPRAGRIQIRLDPPGHD